MKDVKMQFESVETNCTKLGQRAGKVALESGKWLIAYMKYTYPKMEGSEM